jgi:hypothetical protein
MDTLLPFEKEIVKACIIYDSNTKYCIKGLMLRLIYIYIYILSNIIFINNYRYIHYIYANTKKMIIF